MRILAILFGILLMLLGVANYSALGGGFGPSLPILYGALAVLFALLQGRWEHKHALFGTLMMGILSILSSLRGLINLFRLLTGGQPAIPVEAVYVQTAVVALSVVYIILCTQLIPDFWPNWKAFGQFLGDWLGRLVLTVFYFTVFVPFGLGVRLLSDPLHIKSQPQQLWRSRATGDKKLEDVLRQF